MFINQLVNDPVDRLGACRKKLKSNKNMRLRSEYTQRWNKSKYLPKYNDPFRMGLSSSATKQPNGG